MEACNAVVPPNSSILLTGLLDLSGRISWECETFLHRVSDFSQLRVDDQWLS